MSFLDNLRDAALGSRLTSDYGFSSNSSILGKNAAFENLFEITAMSNGENNSVVLPSVIRSEGFTSFDSTIPINNITGISIPSFKFKLKRSSMTRKYGINSGSIEYPGNITIQWMEDDNFSVTHFHNFWKSQYYDEENQCWVTGRPGKFINLKVKVSSHTGNVLTEDSLSPEGKTLVFELRGVGLPSKLPDFSFEYSKADVIKYGSMSYPVESIIPQVIKSSQLKASGEDK